MGCACVACVPCRAPFHARPAAACPTHRLPRKYEYYIFVDDDVYITAPRLFQQLCLKWRPAVAVPGAAIHFPQVKPPNTTEALLITSYDAMANAFHRDVVFDRHAHVQRNRMLLRPSSRQHPAP